METGKSCRIDRGGRWREACKLPTPAASLSRARQHELMYRAMIDAPEAPHQHHPAHTGRRWLDISLALSAMFVSVVSLIVAVEHGHTMERMADANTKMVEANSWPFISFDTHDLNEQGKADVRLVLTN